MCVYDWLVGWCVRCCEVVIELMCVVCVILGVRFWCEVGVWIIFMYFDCDCSLILVWM